MSGSIPLAKVSEQRFNAPGVREFPTLENYIVTIPPGGRTDALVQTVISWKWGERTLRTCGLDADQNEAAIKATVKMLNIFEKDICEKD